MKSDDNLIRADFDLCLLDEASQRMPGPPVVLELAKAVTVASTHPRIEARIVCAELDFPTALAMISSAKFAAGLKAKGVDARWNEKDQALEFPNGSAVVVRRIKSSARA